MIFHPQTCRTLHEHPCRWLARMIIDHFPGLICMINIGESDPIRYVINDSEQQYINSCFNKGLRCREISGGRSVVTEDGVIH